MRFAVFTHVQHEEREGKFHAYSPYIREMNLWLRYVKEVEIVAPLKSCPSDYGSEGSSYVHKQIDFKSVPAFDLLSLKNILRSFIQIPVILTRIFGTMQRANHLHLRCPGNMGLLACVCQIFFPGKPKTAKYAGNWDPKADQPWTYKFQKWILNNTFLTRNMQVLVYGDWPEQSKNIKPFFTASFSEKDVSVVSEKNFSGSITFLFVGNLVPGKHPLKAIQLVQEIKSHRHLDSAYPEVCLEIYGDGPERKMLEAYCQHEKLEGLVKFNGSRPLGELKRAYKKAHFILLPSKSEGWPKAIAEGMFFGCIPIATAVSCVPWMLNYGKRGILLERNSQRPTSNSQQSGKRGQRAEGTGQVNDKTNLAFDVAKPLDLIKDPKEMQSMSLAAKAWSQQYTLEKFEGAIREILNTKPEIINNKQGRASTTID